MNKDTHSEVSENSLASFSNLTDCFSMDKKRGLASNEKKMAPIVNRRGKSGLETYNATFSRLANPRVNEATFGNSLRRNKSNLHESLGGKGMSRNQSAKTLIAQSAATHKVNRITNT